MDAISIFKSLNEKISDQKIWTFDPLLIENKQIIVKKSLVVIFENKKAELLEIKKVPKEEAKKRIPKAQKPVEEPLLELGTPIHNSGIVLMWPFLNRYFDMLGMIEKKAFKTTEDAIRAVLLIQYIASGKAEAPEHEMILNKVLCALPLSTPVPLSIELTENEINITDKLFEGMIGNWGRKSSPQALQEGFFMRDGFILEKEKTWNLNVEKKTLDILLEKLPWAFGMIKLSWMEKRLVVEWI